MRSEFVFVVSVPTANFSHQVLKRRSLRILLGEVPFLPNSEIASAFTSCYCFKSCAPAGSNDAFLDVSCACLWLVLICQNEGNPICTLTLVFSSSSPVILQSSVLLSCSSPCCAFGMSTLLPSWSWVALSKGLLRGFVHSSSRLQRNASGTTFIFVACCVLCVI